jgi:hypothetical protein
LNRFADILREADSRLDLPRPVRSRIILEMAADLDDLFHHFRERGLPADEAEERARQAFTLSDGALEELQAIHVPTWQRFVDHLSGQGRRVWERIALVLLLVFILGAGGLSVLSLEIPRAAGPLGWVLVGLTGTALATALRSFADLFLRERRDLRPVRRQVTALLVFCATLLLTGLYGWWLTIYSWLARFPETSKEGIPLFVQTLSRGSAVVVVALVCTILTALMWYLLQDRLSRLEQFEAATLLDL